MLTIKGQHGRTVVVDGESITLSKRGCGLAPPREKTLPIRHVLAVEVKKPGGVFTGFIRFGTADAAAGDGALAGRVFDAAKDEYAVVFGDEASYETALQIKAYVEDFRPVKA